MVLGSRNRTHVAKRLGRGDGIFIGYHRENGGTLGMVPLIINPIYTLHHVGISWVPIPF